MLIRSRDMGKQRKRNRGSQLSASRDAMKSESQPLAPESGIAQSAGNTPPAELSAERSPSAGETPPVQHDAPPFEARPVPSGTSDDSADGALDVREEHREAIANILKSLTGSTLQGVADVNAASERARRDLIGRRVNNFEIIGLLSSGGMGDVFEAIHLVIHRKVAIKVLRQEHCGDPALVQRFFNEARAANTIRHPNIVEVLDVGMLPGGLPYLAMERLEGETLAQRLSREGRLDIERAVDYAVQAASALQAAHKRGIVHRDLKPDNLFLVPDPRVPGHELVKVLDFGIAKLHGDRLSQVKTNVGSILGTPPYMSPEQCRGIPDAVDLRSDVYALGVILFEMLCGAPPFVAEGVGDVMVMHLSSPPPLPRWRRNDIPIRIEQTILWAMEKNPDQRIPSMGDFIFTLGSGPTPVPYIVTPTGLTTSELPPSLAPHASAPRYSAPAISLEGEFPLEDAGALGTDARDVGASGSGLPLPAGSNWPGSDYGVPSAIPSGVAVERLSERPSRPSAIPTASSRASWRSGAMGALAVAAAVASVVGFEHLRGGEEPGLTASERQTQVPGAPAALQPAIDAARPRHLESRTAALETVDVVAEVNGSSLLGVNVPPSVATPTEMQSGTVAELPPGVLPKPAVGAGPSRWTMRARQSAVTLGNATEVVSALEPPDTHPSAPESVVPEAHAPGSAVAANEEHAANPAVATPGEVEGEARAPSPIPVASERVDPTPMPGSSGKVVTTGTLHFDSTPWARVTLNGRVLGVTPLRGVTLPVGTHQLRLENSELGISRTVVVDIKPGQPVSRLVTWGEQGP